MLEVKCTVWMSEVQTCRLPWTDNAQMLYKCYRFIQEYGSSVYDIMGLVYEMRAEHIFVSDFGLD